MDRTEYQKLTARITKWEELDARIRDLSNSLTQLKKLDLNPIPNPIARLDIPNCPVISIKNALTGQQVADALIPLVEQKLEELEDEIDKI